MNRYERLLMKEAEEANIPFEPVQGSKFQLLFNRARERYGSIWIISDMNCLTADWPVQTTVLWRSYEQLEDIYRYLMSKFSGPVYFLVGPPGDDIPRGLLKLTDIMVAYRLFMESNTLHSFFDENADFLVVENEYKTTIGNGRAAEWLREYNIKHPDTSA